MSRFDFLKKDFPTLYRQCDQLSRDAAPDIILLHCRQILETLVRELGSSQQDLFLAINELEARGILTAKISHLFHTVRRLANQSIHQSGSIRTPQVRSCINQLVELTIWFAAFTGKQYPLKAFSPSDTAVARKYMGQADSAAPKKHSAAVDGIDPLGIDGDFDFAANVPQDILEKDVFETEKEYEQRIASLPPVHIGYGILDTRRQDQYTQTVFLIHHIDQNKKIRFATVNAFFAYQLKADSVIDDEIVACLKVYEGQIWCDYSRVYLKNGAEYIPLQTVSWNRFAYEDKDEFRQRLEKLPVLPLGLALPLRQEYDLGQRRLPFLIKPFTYIQGISKLLFPEEELVISCVREIAKKICSLHTKILLVGRIGVPFHLTEYALWTADLGVLYQTNEEDAARREKAEAAANQGRAAWYLEKESEASSEQERVQWLRAAAEAGDAGAQNRLGVRYADGRGVEKDDEKAVAWYKKSAAQGYGWAESNLGDCYYGGRGVTADKTQALAWYQRGAAHGNSSAENALGNLYYSGTAGEKDYQKAAFWYEKAAEQGLAEAENNIGECYEFGDGVEKDLEKAVSWYQKSAAQDYARAQYNLGECCYEGKTAARDYERAVYWYQKAAKQGYASAQNALANRYFDGKGIAQDYEKAVEWYEKAVAQGHDWAADNLGNCYYNGLGVEQSYEKAAQLYQMAAEKGNATAKNHLGVCYYEGKGVEKNYSRAIALFREAADLGNAWAKYNLGNCCYYGCGIDVNKDLAKEWYRQAAEMGNESAKKKLKALAQEEGKDTETEKSPGLAAVQKLFSKFLAH